MSNKLLNAVIALIENKPEIASDYLRSPEMKGVSISEVQSRLYTSLEKLKADAAREALRDVMQRSLRLVAGSDKDDGELFMFGVVAVETIVEDAIAKLEP